ncbi:nucleotide exchange factor GrpE [Streptomyces caniscabiei]|uniref:nucleotide exchange factor GrpE n=1 Tax=Streptomyces caniscabiei TaxID=2746961 RepID=UPI0029A5FC9B|nr:nucleotide exchange factor GrpE [Streptomyces caniscabiei]MDX2599625.1 nucleotide exchange factor GrpE [Streptomyces caniscabiei]MDX2735080.1 nucleotide exchange factor GrpE [Streptomyces caniscabiei]
MNGPAPAAPSGPPSELDKLRRRVEALSRKRDEAESRLQALLSSLLPLDDLLADTRRRTGALYEARSAREATSAAVALSEQIDAAHLMLRGEFARHDVRPMDAVGRAVDPAEMRVVGTQAHPSAPAGTVLRERVTGFRLGASTLRLAQVVIAVPGPALESEPVPATGDGPDPAASEATPPAGGRRSQPRRTTRSERKLPRKSSAGRRRRSRRT